MPGMTCARGGGALWRTQGVARAGFCSHPVVEQRIVAGSEVGLSSRSESVESTAVALVDEGTGKGQRRVARRRSAVPRHQREQR